MFCRFQNVQQKKNEFDREGSFCNMRKVAEDRQKRPTLPKIIKEGDHQRDLRRLRSEIVIKGHSKCNRLY